MQTIVSWWQLRSWFLISRYLLETGANVLSLPDRDEAWVRRLFERAVGGFYEVVLSPLGWHVRCGGTNTTRACSECGSLTGPQGLRELSVRDWRCVECGVQHDRDVNAARNILRLGAGLCAP